MLRDLEAKIQKTGHGIEWATVDAKVLYHKEKHTFSGSGETFPDEKGEFTRSRLKGRTTKLEEYLSWVFLGVWVLLLAGELFRQVRP